MAVALHRSTRGLGDSVMLEPLFSKLCRKHRVDTIDLFVQQELILVHRYNPYVGKSERHRHECATHVQLSALELRLLYPEYDHIYDVSSAASLFEMVAQPQIHRNRTEIWSEHCGVSYVRGNDPPPTLYLSPEESISALKASIRTGRAIGVGYASVDECRNYPHMDALIERLMWLGEVWVFHDKPLDELADVYSSSRSRVKLFTDIGVRELMWRVKACSVVVSPDSALVHIAGAFQIPTYGIFGPTDPLVRMWDYDVPWNAPPRFRQCGRSRCWYEPCIARPCLSTLHPDTVVSDMWRLLGQRGEHVG